MTTTRRTFIMQLSALPVASALAPLSLVLTSAALVCEDGMRWSVRLA